MKKLLIIVVLLVIAGCCSGCSPSVESLDESFTVRPKELKDCTIFRLGDGYMGHITVVRCPNSTTSTTERVGKTTQTTVVIDGVEYIQKQPN
jgi:hypothetical protein